jgi:hypothetical protein
MDHDPSLLQFLGERCRYAARDWTSSAELWAAYLAVCKDHGFQPVPRASFGRFLASIGGVEPHRYADARGYQGLHLL